jgi:hypothetical protein
MADNAAPKPHPKIAGLGQNGPWEKVNGGYNGPLNQRSENPLPPPSTGNAPAAKPLASPAPAPKKK